MAARTWPAISYEGWRATCDTLHAHSQVLGKLAVRLAPPEPQLQHAALRLTARGMETAPLPLPGDEAALVAALDLHRHEALAERSDGRVERVPLTPDRAVADVAGELFAAVSDLAGTEVSIDPTPQEVPWTVPLDEDREHASYDAAAVVRYHAAATQAALVLAAFRAPYRGRSTQVNAWWGSFDLAVSLFSGEDADPPSRDFIMRNSMNAKEVAVGWWPGDTRYDRAAFYAYAYPVQEGFAGADVGPEGTRWDGDMGLYLLDWDELGEREDPFTTALAFAHSVFQHACFVCEWDRSLAASAAGVPPPVS
jgi:hypothetical protein